MLIWGQGDIGLISKDLAQLLGFLEDFNAPLWRP